MLRLTVDQLRNNICADTSLCIIDVREEFEFAAGHIPHSHNVPLARLRSDFARIGDKPVFLVCTTGKKATTAAEVLEQMGVSDVRVLAGGILAWRVHGQPLIYQSD